MSFSSYPCRGAALSGCYQVVKKASLQREYGQNQRSLQSLASQGYTVQAYDVYAPSLEKAVAGGCKPSPSPAEAAKGVSVLGLMVVNVMQVEELLFQAGVAESESFPGLWYTGCDESGADFRPWRWS